jgi:hypothetical protein
MSYSEEAKKARSKKNTLAVLRSKKELKVFTSLGSNNYEKVVDFPVDAFYINGVSKAFTFTPETKKISFNHVGTISNAFIVYKHFFASSPCILPNDFDSGYEVEFDSRINAIGELKLELDYEKTNIALESSSSIQLENTDGFFDEIFDHIWENQSVEFYSYFENQPLSEIKLIYKGTIENKSFSPKYVSFSLKDRFYALRKKIQLRNFQSTDGSFDSALLGKPMRRIYGKISKLKLTSLSQQKGVIRPGGTVSGSGTTVTGVGTEFLTYLSPGDKLVATVGTEEKEYSIKTVTNDTSLELSETITTSFSGIDLYVKSTIPSRNYNRKWLVAGHLLHLEEQAIVSVVNNTTVELADVSNYEVDDLVDIGGNRYYIRSIKGNNVKVNQNISPLPVVSDLVSKVPVYNLYYGIDKLTYGRDYSVINAGDYSYVQIGYYAEENITPPIAQTVSLTFTNGSRTISRSSGTVDLKTLFKTRDLIKPNNATYSTYYEILAVDETSMTIRSSFTDPTITTTPFHKKMAWIEDDSIICADCVGKENTLGAKWLRTASDIVSDVIQVDAAYAINSASFDKASYLAPFKISGIFPDNDGDDAPAIKDVISKINQSVFGSLFYDSNYDFKYSILNSYKPENLEELAEDDVISYSVQTKNNIISKASLEYRPETDLNTGDGFKNVLDKTSTFVQLTSGLESEEKLETLIYDDANAQTMLERFLFFRSLTNATVNVKSKLNLALLNLNDVISISFDRIYKRYGGTDKRKVGIINSISKNETETSIVLSDMSNLFNRVPAIAPNTSDDILNSTNQEIAKYGFIVDNNSKTPDNTEKYTGANLIG